MKLLKKIMAVAIVAAMAITASSVLLVVQAAQVTPTLEATLVDDGDGNDKTGIIKFTLKNLRGDTESDTANLSMNSLQVELEVKGAEFNTDLYSTGKGAQIGNNFVPATLVSSGAVVGYKNDVLAYAWAVSAGDGIDDTKTLSNGEKFNFSELTDFLTLNYELTGDSATINLLTCESVVGNMNSKWNAFEGDVYTYGTTNASAANWNFTPIVIGGEEPGDTDYTPEISGTDMDTVYEGTEEHANDNKFAVAKHIEFSATDKGDNTHVRWFVKVNNDKTWYNDYEIPTINADGVTYKMGLVVGYEGELPVEILGADLVVPSQN